MDTLNRIAYVFNVEVPFAISFIITADFSIAKQQ